MQYLWISKLDWDEPLDFELFKKWCEFKSPIPKLSVIKIPRWYNSVSLEWHLHGFADASARAYSATAFFVVPNRTSMLIMSKSRVAPIKTQSLPRLELCATVLLVRLLKHIFASVTDSA